MSDGVLQFNEPADLEDLSTFVSRAKSIQDDGVRLQATGQVLAAWVPVLAPRGLGDRTPTVLGLRTSALAAPAELDVVVPLAAVLDRLARGQQTELPVPPMTSAPSWAAVSAPLTCWEQVTALAADDLLNQAKAGVKDVAEAVPEQPGAAMVSTARAHVWSDVVPGSGGMPSGAAFAGYSLGFWRPGSSVQLWRSGTWWRLSAPAGHVLAKPSVSF